MKEAAVKLPLMQRRRNPASRNGGSAARDGGRIAKSIAAEASVPLSVALRATPLPHFVGARKGAKP
jgi:hypothetical protein